MAEFLGEPLCEPLVVNSFWQDLRRDGRFLRVQAPMEGLSDIAFRTWLCRNAAPDVYYTEFSSAKGLLQDHADTLRRLKHELDCQSTMRPLVAQLWGNDSAEMAPALEELQRRGFSGVDLNFGCPHKKIIAKPAGSGLLQLEHQDRALAMLQECLNARASGLVPPNFGISVKTRLGFEHIDWDFLAQLLQLSASADHFSSDKPEEKQKQKQKKAERGLDALIVHFRLAVVPKKHINHKDNLRWARFSAALPQPLQDGPCYWQYSHNLRDLRDLLRPQTLLIGNGGLAPWRGADWQDAEATGLDGWMAARALFDDPLYFRRGKRNIWPELPLEQRLMLLHEHLLLYRELVEPDTTQASFPSEIQTDAPSKIRSDSKFAGKGSRIELYEIFKKFYRIYLPNTGPSQKREESLRHALQQSQNLQAALDILEKYLENIG